MLMGASPWYFSLDAWINIAKGVMGLGFVIFVHELGHFLAAKACGVKCEKFYVGFDPPMNPVRNEVELSFDISFQAAK